MSGSILSRIASQDLSSAALDVDLTFENSGRLLTVYVTSSVALTEEITITFKSKDGSNYNTVLADRILDTESDYVYTASGMVALNISDSINVSCTNANGVGTVYVTVKMETDYH